MAAEFTTEMGVLAGITELNNRFECFIGEEEPNPTYPCMFWANRETGILKQRNVSNDGWVTLYSLSTGALSLLDSVYPVGTIYENGATDTNPAELFGFGTWEPFGEGRVTVGVDASQVDFDAVGKTGGEKNIKLEISQMPAHNHGNAGNHQHSFVGYYGGSQYGSRGPGLSYNTSSSCTGSKTVSSSTSGSHTHSTQGSGHSHNNLQPYITVYRWIRVA